MKRRLHRFLVLKYIAMRHAYPIRPLLAASALALLTPLLHAQRGEAVANDLRTYITAPAASKSADRSTDDVEVSHREVYRPDASPGLEPEKPKRDPVTFRPEEHLSIDGQQVDETNNVVYKAFEEHPEWKQVTVVADWTGSMYPYAGQVMRWHRMNMDRKLVAHMVLFNDGDDSRRGGAPKPMGAAGGMYHPDPNNLDDFLDKVKVAIDNGDGGESEENDVEALIEAQSKYPETTDIVLVADNSGVRDMTLMAKLNRRVHVVLVNNGWVKDYVKIAYATRGTVTTSNESLDFSKDIVSAEGTVMLNGLVYKVR